MAYVPCIACGIHHKNLTQRDVIVLVTEFQNGNGQLMTPEGVESLCLLEILGLPPTQKQMRMNPNGRQVVSLAAA